MTLACQRHLFDIPRDVCYLNSAYMSPIPRPVREAGAAGLERRATPWQIGAEDFLPFGPRAQPTFPSACACPECARTFAATSCVSARRPAVQG